MTTEASGAPAGGAQTTTTQTQGNQPAGGAQNESGATGQPSGNQPAGGSAPANQGKGGEAPAANGGVQTVSYEPSGDAGLDMALQFLGKHGIGPEHPAMKAAENNDFSMLKAHFAALGIQGSAEMLALGEQAYGRRSAEAKAAAEASKAAIFAVCGGEEGWNQIKTWVGKNATDAEKAEITSVMQKGGLTAKVMATWLAGKAGNDPSMGQKPANVRDPAAGGQGQSGAATSGPLDSRGYRDAVQALVAKRGTTNIDHLPEYKALQQRRAAYKG